MNEIPQLKEQGYLIKGEQIDSALIDRALHVIHRDLYETGISKREIEWWKQAANWFPHLREHEAILALRDALPEEWRQGVACEPQILLGMPDLGPSNYNPAPHIDQEPPWANGRRYRAIVGVPLTRFSGQNGGVSWSYGDW